MSDSISIDETVTRQPRQPREENHAPVVEAVSVNEGNGQEDILADAQRALESRDRELEEARQAAQHARTEAANARNEAARANMARAGDRAAAVAAAIESAKTDQELAKSAKRAAREAGDLDAEFQADEAYQSALYRYNQANGELQWLTQQQQQQPARQQQQPSGDGLTDAARQWIAAHPRFNTDRRYRAVAEGAHNDALRNGFAADSPEYFRHIEGMLAEDDAARSGASRMNGNGRNVGSTAAPSNRGSSSGNSSSGTVMTLMGIPLTVSESGGRTTIHIPPQHRADMEEAASINKMRLADYCYEQVKIARERQAGGTAGWIQGDGQVQV